MPRASTAILQGGPEDHFVNSYQAVRQRYPPTARSHVRAATLSAFAWANRRSDKMKEGLRRARVQFLLLHHVFADEKEQFRRLLRDLRADHTFIPYSEAVDRIWQGRIDRPYLAFSVDDGFKNNLAVAEILEEFGATACFFVCPSIVGVTDVAKIHQFANERLRFVPTSFLSWCDVELLRKRGHEIGSHTQSHPNLAECSVEQAQSEIGESRRALEEHCGAIKHFAWPFGRFRQFDAAAKELVFKAGYQSCASGERGCHFFPEPDPSQLCLRRDNVVAAWPTMHVLYFLTRNSCRLSQGDNRFPY